MAHPAVAATTVIGLPHPHWTEAVTAFVILRPDMDATEADIIKSCRAELGGYELPKRVVFLTTLATTATGKFLKAPLREQYTDLYSNEPA